MMLSALTVTDAAKHIRTDPDDSLIPIYLEAAQMHVLDYTGLTPEEADKYPDLAVAALILTADLYDNRQATVDSGNVNRVLQSFLGLHSRNLI